MPSLLRFACLGLFMTLAHPALALDDTPQNRAAEAARYLQAVPPEMMAAGMAQRMASSLPQQQHGPFLQAMRKNLNMAAINAAAQAGLVKVFTADELKAMADFYGSPAGQAAMGKMGNYMQEVMPTIGTEVQTAAQKAQQDTGAQLPQMPQAPQAR